MISFKPKIKNKKNHFEGWYLRIITEEINLVFIFGRSNNKEDSHCFIQFYDSRQTKNQYFRYNIEEFTFDNSNKKEPKVFIGKNFISPKQIYFQENKVKLSASFEKPILLKKYFFSRSAISFFQYFPLPCFQEIIFMDAKCKLNYSNSSLKKKSFQNIYQNVIGNAYLEKSFGKQFPHKWYWIQCNTFNDKKNLSFSFSYGELFYLGGKKKLFFAILRNKQKEYRFAIYNLSKINIIKSSLSKKLDEVEIIFKKGKYTLKIYAISQKKVELIGPQKNGLMIKKVFECIDAKLQLKIYRKEKQKEVEILSANGKNVGFEAM